MRTVEYLDALRVATGAQSDYALMKHLGVKKQTISRYRNGIGQFDDSVAIRVAELLGKEPIEVLAAVNAERTHDENARAAWLKLLEKGFPLPGHDSNVRRDRRKFARM